MSASVVALLAMLLALTPWFLTPVYIVQCRPTPVYIVRRWLVAEKLEVQSGSAKSSTVESTR